MKKYKVIIDRDKCLGCGTCEAVSPEFFHLNSQDALVEVVGFNKVGNNLVGEIDETQLAAFQLAADICPELVIKIKK